MYIPHAVPHGCTWSYLHRPPALSFARRAALCSAGRCCVEACEEEDYAWPPTFVLPNVFFSRLSLLPDNSCFRTENEAVLRGLDMNCGKFCRVAGVARRSRHRCRA